MRIGHTREKVRLSKCASIVDRLIEFYGLSTICGHGQLSISYANRKCTRRSYYKVMHPRHLICTGDLMLVTKGVLTTHRDPCGIRSNPIEAWMI